MVSCLLPALVLLQLSAAAPTLDDRYLDPAGGRGTNANSPAIGRPGRQHRVGTDYERALGDTGAQPALPVGGRCTYAYADAPQALQLFAAAEPFVSDANVAQGGIGDCGLGAAVAAIALRGLSRLLRAGVTDLGGGAYEFAFTRERRAAAVRVDSRLPAAADARRCPALLGYQVVPTASLGSPGSGSPGSGSSGSPGSLGSLGSPGSGYVPLLEKAVAKFSDARAYDNGEGRGYPGLQGVPAEFVLELLTGGRPRTVARDSPGLDAGLLAALDRCLTRPEPCVLGTPNAAHRWFSRHPDSNATHTFLPDHRAGYTSGVIHLREDTGFYEVTDFGNGGAVNTLIPHHAWALDVDRTTYRPGGDVQSGVVRIINPWGDNARPWHALDRANALELSVPTLVSIIDEIATVEGIPGVA